MSDALSHLAATQGLDNHLLYQVELLSNISTNNPSQHALYPPLNIPTWSKQRSCKDLELKYDGPGEAACETPLHNILPARYWTLCITMFSQVLTLFFSNHVFSVPKEVDSLRVPAASSTEKAGAG